MALLKSNEKAMVMRTPKTRIENHGSLYLFRPLNKSARVWLETHTNGQWFDDALVVEPRYAGMLAERMQDDGIIFN